MESITRRSPKLKNVRDRIRIMYDGTFTRQWSNLSKSTKPTEFSSVHRQLWDAGYLVMEWLGHRLESIN